jgi:tetratricopeptide (TPR) repeat protein
MAWPKSWLMTLVVLTSVQTAHADGAASAREHYREGTKLFDLRRYRDAAKEYEAAFQLKDDPALLFNIGQAYRLAGDYEDAIASYRSFLRRVSRAGNRAEVEARIHEMQELLAAQKRQHEAPPEGTLPPKGNVEPPRVVEPPPPVEPPRAVAPPPPALSGPSQADRTRGRTLKIAGVTVVAVGIVALGVGAGFAALAEQASDQLNRAKQDQPFDAALDRRGKTDQGVAIGLLAGGGAAIVGGVALWLVGRHASRRNSFVLAPSAGAQFAGAFAAGSF